jgi:DNA-binding CsgD family transcriptional regulator/N-acetylneuraminic acid mutarotase
MQEGPIEPLSDRERELVQLLGQGLSNREIARELVISPNTVKVHLRNIYSKLNVSSRTEATMVALRHGLIEIDLPQDEDSRETSRQPSGDPDGPGGSKASTETQTVAETLPVPAPRPPLALWQRVYVVLSLILVALGLWLIWPSSEVQPGPFDVRPAPATGQPLNAVSRWKGQAQMPTPRRRLAVAAYEQQIYAIGGDGISGITGAVEIYAPEADDWRRGADKLTPAADIGAVVLGSRIYVPGGTLAGGQVSDQLEIYTPNPDGTGRWESGSKMPEAVSAYAIAAHGETLYIFGGWDGATYSKKAFKYELGKESWTPLEPMGVPRAFAGAGTVGDRIYVVGGYDGESELDACEVYDPTVDQWSTCPPMNAPRGGVGVAVVADTLYAIGGGWQSYLVENEYLNLSLPSADLGWRTFPSPLLEEWRNMGVAANGTFIYAVGGWDGDYLAVNQAYRALYSLYLPSIQQKTQSN